MSAPSQPSLAQPPRRGRCLSALIKRARLKELLFKVLLLTPGLICAPAWAAPSRMPGDAPQAYKALEAGQSMNLIVEYDSAEVEQEARALRQPSDRFEPDTVTRLRASRYADIKRRVADAMPGARLETLQDYSHLPMRFQRVRSAAALDALLAEPRVKAVYLNKPHHRVGTANLDLIAQPAASAVAYQGAGSTVAVLDDGIDYTNSAFGGCTAPGTPSSCQVIVSRDFGTGSTDHNHGTNVSAIVLAIAPSAKVAALNVFSGSVAYSADILSAFNWAIRNRSAYNIVAINMSLGDGNQNTSACSSNNPYLTPTNNAMKAGITVVAAAGNEAYSNAMGSPACTPGVVSVAAVYAANFGGLNWGATLCTDYTTAADQVACFSNSASFTTMWAPGALITAGGITQGGTSQASPHVAGAVAVLRAAFPGDTLSTTLSRLTTSRTLITDARNGQTKPRLDLEAAARPANDLIANAANLSNSSGTVSGTNRLASLEASESRMDPQSGGRTVWWKWVAPAIGQLSLNTHGSDFDTMLSVQTGTSASTLQRVAFNDNDGAAGQTSGLLFQAAAGTTYLFAVDGTGSAQGAATLNWSLNTSAQANLAIASLTGPGSPPPNTTATYTVTISNAGPQSATNIKATVTLPEGVSLVSATSACQTSTTQVRCSVGNMASGSSLAFDLTLQWNAIGPQTLSASVNSDLPDNISSDNTAGVQITATSLDEDADTPTLPEWAAIVLAGLLLAHMVRSQAGVPA